MRQSSKLFLWFLIALGMGLVIGVDARAQVPQDKLVDAGYAAEFTDRAAGSSAGTLAPATDLALWRNGTVGTSVLIPSDDPATRATGSLHSFVIRAYGTPAGGVWPTMQVWIDGTLRQTFTVASATAADYIVTTPVRAGWRTLRLSFTNDAVVNGADRNLMVRAFFVYAGEPAGLSGNAGTFPMQSVSVLSGYFGPNPQFFGLNEPCDPALPGCAAINAIRAVGANDITFTTVCTVEVGSSWCRPQIAGNDEERALRVAIRQARRLGMGVTLKAAVVYPNTGSYVPLGSTSWTPPNPGEFFLSMQRMLENQARLARQEGVGLLVIGTELGGRFTAASAFNSNCTTWQRLIDGVRGAALATAGTVPLKLTYAPAVAGFWNDLNANEAPYVCFWDRLDYIGLNAYHHMNFAGATTAAPRALLGNGWQAYRRMFSADNPNANVYDDLRVDQDPDTLAAATANDPGEEGHVRSFRPALSGFEAFALDTNGPDSYRARYGTDRYSTKWYVDYVIDRINERFRDSLAAQGRGPMKAVLTEVGVPSSPQVHGHWGRLTPWWNWQSSWPLYVDQQALAWDGYLRAFRGDPRIHGISVWGVLPYRARDWPADPVDSRHFLVDHDFIGKRNAAGWRSTEERLCAWFKKTAPQPCFGN